MDALSISNLRKVYGNGFEAVKGIDLKVKKGDFFALLGPNGAGKSTTIGIITSLVNKTSGKVKVFGHDLDRQRDLVKSHIGVVPQEINVNIFEKVLDIVVTQAGYYGIPRALALERAEKYLKKLELWDKRDQPARNLSGGMKRRLMIARALIHEPKLLILDEPTAGVDIEIRRSMWDFLIEHNKKGLTIILTTHYLEEAEQLCKNIAIIHHGNIIEDGSMKNLIKKLDREIYILDLKKPIKAIKPNKKFNLNLTDPSTVEVDIDTSVDLNLVFEHLAKQGITIQSMRNKENRLESLFVNLIKK